MSSYRRRRRPQEPALLEDVLEGVFDIASSTPAVPSFVFALFGAGMITGAVAVFAAGFQNVIGKPIDVTSAVEAVGPIALIACLAVWGLGQARRLVSWFGRGTKPGW